LEDDLRVNPNPLLSISLPTFNRAEYVDACLRIHIPLAKKCNVAILVCDNASTDNTESIVRQHMLEYPLLQYRRNQTTIGPDENFETALKSSQSKYVWLLGDTYRIAPEGIDYVINLISTRDESFDAIVVNLADRMDKVDTQDFRDCNLLLKSLGALMTCLSCLIYSRELIDKASFTRFHGTNFLQTGAIFESLAGRDFAIHWAKSISVYGLDVQNADKKPWSMTPHVFRIAGERWTNFVFSLPATYNVESKLECIMSHTRISGVFSFRRMLWLRSENIFNLNIYKEYHHIFPFVVEYPRPILAIVAILPKSLLRFLRRSNKK
jgi:glycosyltransferase involved in cell wall biosynthesis